MNAESNHYFEQGLEFFDSGDFETAIVAFTKALRLALGDLSEILLFRGSSYAYLNKYDNALEDFNESLRLNAYKADTYNERGNLYRFMNRLDEAIADYDIAISLDPSHYEALYNRALAYEMQGDMQQAEADLTASINIYPGTAAAYEVRGRIRSALKDYDGAIQDLQRYLRMGGGRQFDNHSEIQSQLIGLQFSRLIGKIFRIKI